MPEEPVAPWRLMRLMDGFVTTQLLYVAAELGVPDALADGPRTAVDLADAVGARAGPLARVLRGLVVEEVLTEDQLGRFGLTPLGEALRTLGGAAQARAVVYYAAAAGLLDAVREGGTPFEHVHGERFFDRLERLPDHQAAFEASMAGRAEHEAAAVVAALGAPDLGTVVDVGGGRGVLLAALLRADPRARGILVDRGALVGVASSHLREFGVGDRAEVLVGDFFEEVPAGHDTYVLSRVLHDWDDVEATLILQRCRAAMPPPARLLVVDAILPRLASELPAAIRMDLHMLVLLGARERTEDELRRLLAGAGFAVSRVIPTGSPSGLGIVEASPAVR